MWDMKLQLWKWVNMKSMTTQSCVNSISKKKIEFSETTKRLETRVGDKQRQNDYPNYRLSCNKPEWSCRINTCLYSSVNSVSFSFSLHACLSLSSLINQPPSCLENLCSALFASLYFILYLCLSLPNSLFWLQNHPPSTVLSHCFNVNRMLCFLPPYSPKQRKRANLFFFMAVLSLNSSPGSAPMDQSKNFPNLKNSSRVESFGTQMTRSLVITTK